jgi:ribosomal protein L11 methyltransferase
VTPASVWKVALAVPARHGGAFAAAVEPFVGALSIFESADRRHAEITGYAAGEPDRARLQRALAAAATVQRIAAPRLDVVWLPAIDWVAENRASFAPIRAARFHIHDSDHLEPPPPGTIAIRIDAATAFGTGRHATTFGCLEAIERIAQRRGRAVLAPALDLGCGTGVLAIAAAKRLRVRVTASDVDPAAVAMARANVRRNGVAGLVIVHRGCGLAAAAVRRPGPYGLILANILARPLALLAPAIARALAPGGGTVVLSGLLRAQEAQVLSAYRAQGLYLAERIRRDEWSTLVLG